MAQKPAPAVEKEAPFKSTTGVLDTVYLQP